MSREQIRPLLAAAATIATLWSLSPLIDASTWWGPSLLVIAIVLGVGGALRHLHVPDLLVAPAQVLLGVVGLTAVFAGTEALWGLFAEPDAVRALARVLAAGADTIRRYPAPVPMGAGISLIVAGGVLLVAMLVDLLAVTLRAPAAAGIPLLALYAVPAAVLPTGLSWTYFALAASGWLVLLGHDASTRVLGWGRLLPLRGQSTKGIRRSVAGDTGALAATGRRLGMTAVACAIAVPALLPSLSQGWLATSGARGGAGPDPLTGLTVINPVLTLRDNLLPRRDLVVLRYRTSQLPLAPLRILTADTFDLDTWKPGMAEISRSQLASRGLPAPPGLSASVAQHRYTMQIRVGNALDQDFLPLPYPSQRVEIQGRWLYDASSLNVIGDGETVRGKTYTVDYLAVQPTAQQLRASPPAPAAIHTAFTQLPALLPDVVRTTAERVTSGASTNYDKAMALQSWFRDTGGFSYSTNAPSSAGGDAVEAFLREKRGFCVQFSSAMAVMARSLGIPARIGVGFLPGTSEGSGGYVVRLTDAHAWPELYFEGAGWVRFEPTPAIRTGPAPAWAQPSSPGGTSPTDAPTAPGASAPGGHVGNKIGQLPDQSAASAPLPPAVPATTPAPARPLPWRGVALGLLVILAGTLAPATAAVSRWRRHRNAQDDRARAEAAWTDLREGALDLGLPVSPSRTPRQVAAQLALVGGLAPGGATLALDRVTRAVEHSRYAPSATAAEHLDADVQAILRALASTRRPVVRLGAKVLPRSGLAVLRRLVGRIAR